MCLKIIHNETKIRLWLPNGLLLNPATAAIAARLIRKHASAEKCPPFSLNAKSLRRLFRRLKASKRLLKGAPLIAVASTDGSCVQIHL